MGERNDDKMCVSMKSQMTNPKSPIAALIFDFDGLIIDTETPQYQTWRDVWAAHGAHLPAERWIELLGKPPTTADLHAELEEKIGRSLDRAAVKGGRGEALMRIIDGMPVLPGVREYLRDAKSLGLKLAVASGSPRDWVERFLKQRELFDWFDAIVTGEDTERHKPNPEPFLEAAKRIGAAAERCIVFEDSTNGIRAARAAGMFAVAVPNPLTHGLDFPAAGADLQLVSMADMSLAELVARAGAASASGIPGAGGG